MGLGYEIQLLTLNWKEGVDSESFNIYDIIKYHPYNYLLLNDNNVSKVFCFRIFLIR